MKKFRQLSLQDLVYKWNKRRRNFINNTTLLRNDYETKKKIKLFSLLDINDKITNSKGTSLPAQYKRYNINNEENEIHNRYGFTHRINQRYQINKNNSKKLIRCKSDIGDRLKLKKKFKLNNTITNANNDQKRNSSKNLINSTYIKKDSLLPKGYDSYELLVKNHKLFRKKMKLGNLLDNMISPKKMKQIELKSDIFFAKPPSEKESPPKYIIRKNEYKISDIFNMKNDPKNLSKSGETYLFKNQKRIKFNISSESNSKWKISDNKIPSMTNYSSKEYNIINPKSKGISFTKDNLMAECENRKNKESKMINNINYMNPIFKQKGLTEFIDITRNGAKNELKNYIDAYNKNPKCFFKNNNMCTKYFDIHHQYNNICEKPFYKNLF